ncbi:hypothetical protein SAMN04488128_1021051 [Chitinophaga eiseniae]|uniref:Uncharacterized protein n=1 Tax=Chitinophaga eiseniae TaxID=634771 RepID=A0A1T4RDG0_9BACT|nr:hypothetical protein [Chitinophaga eiseniae]SKA14062.1 hypothetical protein SAMN04488128_1021051 [Chitinophaga eiseniae]
MEKIGHIEIRITGSIGNIDLSPDNYDIREIREVLEYGESLLSPNNDKKDRPLITYQLEKGSVRHIFKTSIQYIIGFNAVLGQVAHDQSIDFLDLPTAKAFECFQDMARKKRYVFEINTSLENSNSVSIDQNTRFSRTTSVWADAEFYFYGKITNMGGKDKSNIHISTSDQGIVIVHTSKDYLEKLENNLLYKPYGIRAVGKQHTETGEIDKSSLKFIELIDYHPKYDEDYLNALRKKASHNWEKGFDADAWLRELRGGYDA